MRRHRVFVALLLAPSFAACLVSVDESLLDPAEELPDRETQVDGASAIADGDASADASADADADAKVDADAAPPSGNACVGREFGLYCGRSLPSYVGGTQDLVRCLPDGGIGQIFDCADGCAGMPSGRQDLCNPCVGAAPGNYCAQQLNANYKHDDVLVTCSAGVVSSAKICTNKCAVSGSNGVCN